MANFNVYGRTAKFNLQVLKFPVQSSKTKFRRKITFHYLDENAKLTKKTVERVKPK